MNIYIINNPFHYEIENLTRAFLNNEKMNVIKCDENVNREKPFVAIELIKHEKDSDIRHDFFDSLGYNSRNGKGNLAVVYFSHRLLM